MTCGSTARAWESVLEAAGCGGLVGPRRAGSEGPGLHGAPDERSQGGEAARKGQGTPGRAARSLPCSLQALPLVPMERCGVATPPCIRGLRWAAPHITSPQHPGGPGLGPSRQGEAGSDLRAPSPATLTPRPLARTQVTTPALPGSAAAVRLPSWGLWLTKPLRGLNHPKPLAFQGRGGRPHLWQGWSRTSQGWEGGTEAGTQPEARMRENCVLSGLPRAEPTLRVGAEELI